MRLHYLQHDPHEDPLEIGAWVAERGHTMTGTRLFDGDPLPALDAFDALVLMGGPMNIYEEAAHPWLVPEKALLRAALDAGKGALGVCLGAQLLADVLGGPVTRNPEREIGWFEVALTPEGRAHPIFAGVPEVFTCLHWHGDTFAMPPGTVHAATSAACAHQAFVTPDGKVVGLQFHIEENGTGVDLLLEHACAEIIDGPFVQAPEQIAGLAVETSAKTRPILFRLLDNWAACLAG